jgi:hypothetical protein
MAKTIRFVPSLDLNDSDIPQMRKIIQSLSFTDSFVGDLGPGNPGLVTIGTSEETIDFGDVVPGLVMLWNLDDENHVNYGCVITAGTGGELPDMGFRLNPQGMPAFIWLEAGYDLVLQADTASCKVMVLGFND